MEAKDGRPEPLPEVPSEALSTIGELRGTVHRWLTKHDAGFVLPDEPSRKALGLPKGMRLRAARRCLAAGFQPQDFTAGRWVGFRPALDLSPASAHAGRMYCAVEVRPLRPEEYEDLLHHRGVCGGAGLAGVGPSFLAAAGELDARHLPAWVLGAGDVPEHLLCSVRQQLRGFRVEDTDVCGPVVDLRGTPDSDGEADMQPEPLAPSCMPEVRPEAFRPLTIGFASTFALDTLEAPMQALLAHGLGLPATLRWVPYGTVLQALTSDTSGKLHCGEDVSVVALFIRLEDLVYNHPEVRAQAPGAATTALVAVAAEQLLESVTTSSSRPGAAQHLVFLCPASPLALSASALGMAALHRCEWALYEALRDKPRVTCVTSAALRSEFRLPPVAPPSSPNPLLPSALHRPWLPAGVEDDQLHVPYPIEGFTALALATARLTCRTLSPGLKVLCLDCDNTLWDGAVAEVGPQGVGLQGPHRVVQEVALQLQQRGVLLALVSRNEEEDVLAVFRQRAAELVLPLSAVVARRIGWGPKSASIASIAEELRLGLDAFAFLDDSPVECGEVRQQLPTVKVGLLPHDVRLVPAFLRQWWPLDSPTAQAAATAEDTVRTELYHQEAARRAFRATTASSSAFLASLRLKIDIATVRATSLQVQRIAQLTERTNQFVSYKEVLNEAAVDAFINAGISKDFPEAPPNTSILAVSVTDRFGHYGLIASSLLCTDQAFLLVGSKATSAATDLLPFLTGALLVRAFLMSCRVLHRGVEHALVRRLAEEAAARGKEKVAFRFTVSERNHIGERFLRSLPGALFFPAGHAIPVDPVEEFLPREAPATADSDSDVEPQDGSISHNGTAEQAADGSFPVAQGPCSADGRLQPGWVVMTVQAAATFDLDPDVALSEPSEGEPSSATATANCKSAVTEGTTRPIRFVGDGARLWLDSDTYASIAHCTASLKRTVTCLAALEGTHTNAVSPLQQAIVSQLKEASRQSAAGEEEEEAVQRACQARRQLRHAIKVGVHKANTDNPTFVAPQGPIGAGDSYF